MTREAALIVDPKYTPTQSARSNQTCRFGSSTLHQTEPLRKSYGKPPKKYGFHNQSAQPSRVWTSKLANRIASTNSTRSTSIIPKLQIIGIPDSEKLRNELARFSFLPIGANQIRPLYVRPIHSMTNVPHFSLDATNWKNYDDLYDALFKTLGSPAWHGRNFNALNDSIAGGNINAIEVPYYLSILNLKSATTEVQSFVSELVGLIADIQSRGCPVSIRIDG